VGQKWVKKWSKTRIFGDVQNLTLFGQKVHIKKIIEERARGLNPFFGHFLAHFLAKKWVKKWSKFDPFFAPFFDPFLTHP